MKQKSGLKVKVWMWLWLAVFGGAELFALEGAGVGEDVLKGVHNAKTSQAAADVIRSAEKEPRLALAALGMYLRYHKDFSGMESVDPILLLAKRPGLRDRVALVLAFNRGMRRKNDNLGKVIQHLAGHTDPAARELAAATLATLSCHRYITNPEVYPSLRNDEKKRVKYARSVEIPMQSWMDSPPGNMKSRKTHNRKMPKIPMGLFTESYGDTRVLATIAAAFDGSPEYHDAVYDQGRAQGTLAGAMLLYFSRQKEVLTTENAQMLFKAAFAQGAAVPIISRASRGPQIRTRFSPLLPGEVLACMAAGQLKLPELQSLVEFALAHSDTAVQIEAVRALRSYGLNEQSIITLAKFLPQASGPVLPDLCATLGLYPDARMVPLLLLRLQKEEGRYRLDLSHALASIAGHQEGGNTEEWIDWWKKTRSVFEVDRAASKKFWNETPVQTMSARSYGSFYGMSIYSHRLAYVVDTSLSMKGSRINSLRENFTQSLESLKPVSGQVGWRKPEVRFNIIDFGGDVVAMESEGLTDDINEGLNRVEEMPLTYGTRTYDALDRGLELEGVDSIYFLSDGAPYWGQVESWSSVLEALDLLTLHDPVAIWCVAFDPKGDNGKAMKTLALENSGLYATP
ncbi:VWA domain-containing protein [Kiritimatiellaeota bacterium B1221]|nr:VWA domain-containing protein [Kiritimatiellaeota bacterium B1221]